MENINTFVAARPGVFARSGSVGDASATTKETSSLPALLTGIAFGGALGLGSMFLFETPIAAKAVATIAGAGIGAGLGAWYHKAHETPVAAQPPLVIPPPSTITPPSRIIRPPVQNAPSYSGGMMPSQRIAVPPSYNRPSKTQTSHQMHH